MVVFSGSQMRHMSTTMHFFSSFCRSWLPILWTISLMADTKGHNCQSCSLRLQHLLQIGILFLPIFSGALQLACLHPDCRKNDHFAGSFKSEDILHYDQSYHCHRYFGYVHIHMQYTYTYFHESNKNISVAMPLYTKIKTYCKNVFGSDPN